MSLRFLPFFYQEFGILAYLLGFIFDISCFYYTIYPKQLTFFFICAKHKPFSTATKTIFVCRQTLPLIKMVHYTMIRQPHFVSVVVTTSLNGLLSILNGIFPLCSDTPTKISKSHCRRNSINFRDQN